MKTRKGEAKGVTNSIINTIDLIYGITPVLWRLLARPEVEIHLPDCIRKMFFHASWSLFSLSEEILVTLVPWITSICKFVRMGGCD